MYGMPNLGYGGEVVTSMSAMTEAIKRRQVLSPRSKFAIHVAGDDIEVNLLPNGFVELDGMVRPLVVEKEIEDVMREYGAVLRERVV